MFSDGNASEDAEVKASQYTAPPSRDMVSCGAAVVAVQEERVG